MGMLIIVRASTGIPQRATLVVTSTQFYCLGRAPTSIGKAICSERCSERLLTSLCVLLEKSISGQAYGPEP